MFRAGDPLRPPRMNEVMKSTLLRNGLILGAALAACVVASAAAQARRVEIANHSSHAMIQFFASSTATPEWGGDILGSVLPGGQSRAIALSGGAGSGCLYDLKAVFDDGRAVERHSVNVCTGPVPPFEDEASH